MSKVKMALAKIAYNTYNLNFLIILICKMSALFTKMNARFVKERLGCERRRRNYIQKSALFVFD